MNFIKNRCSFFVTALLPAILPGIAAQPSARGDTVTAIPARQFLDSLGVCTHVGQGVDDAAHAAPALAFAGIANVRDDASDSHVKDWIFLHEKAGVRVVLTRSGPRDSAIPSLIGLSRQLAKQGFKYTFIYMLRDAGGSDAGYGIFEKDYKPKKSATYLHNLTSILADRGSPKSEHLDYTISHPPPTVHDLLLCKSDGSLELIVWNERASGSDQVTIELQSARTSVKIYDPVEGTTPIQVLRGARSVELKLSDHPMVVEM